MFLDFSVCTVGKSEQLHRKKKESKIVRMGLKTIKIFSSGGSKPPELHEFSQWIFVDLCFSSVFFFRWFIFSIGFPVFLCFFSVFFSAAGENFDDSQW